MKVKSKQAVCSKCHNELAHDDTWLSGEVHGSKLLCLTCVLNEVMRTNGQFDVVRVLS